MEPRKTLNFNQKNSSIINNRNLKDYSCFIGAKTPKQANEFYNYINIKYSLNDVDVWLDVPFTIDDKEFLFSFYEIEIPTKTVNLVPLAIDGVLRSAELDPVMDNHYETRKGNWYIAIEVYDQNYKDCLSAEFDYRKEIIEYLVLLKNEYLATSNYNEVLFKD